MKSTFRPKESIISQRGENLQCGAGQSKLLRLAPLFIFISLQGCGNDEEAAGGLPKGPRIKNSENIELVIIGNNSDDIEKHSEQRESAKAYLKKTEVAVEEIVSMKKLPEGPALSDQNRKLNALVDEGDEFEPFPLGHLSHCREAGFDARYLFQVLAGILPMENSAPAFKKWKDAAVICESEIKTAPEPTTKIVGSSKYKSPPFPGCLRILELGGDNNAAVQEWNCPSQVIPKI